ncbi:hypothetical protein GCM10010405_23220 [Streptomyces macrosporus]|uniref:Uncharacterized protein n=1 Tax=Streptomyces macrosporus TaxID=44032 RepID=A0ABN3JVV9_9ACTN
MTSGASGALRWDDEGLLDTDCRSRNPHRNQKAPNQKALASFKDRVRRVACRQRSRTAQPGPAHHRTAGTAHEAGPETRPAARRRPDRQERRECGDSKTSAAFQRGIAALARYIARGGHHRAPGGHAEEITPESETTPVRLGVFMSNTKQRRDRPSDPQRAALREPGVEWA